MKITHFLSFFLFLFISGNISAQKLIQVWETTQDLKTPESVIYDETNDVIYVANINGNADEKDGNGFISKISTTGKIKKLIWVKGLDAPKGMGIFGNKLYVSDIDKVVEIDINKGEISKIFDVPDAVFLNDVTVRINGDVYISDTRTGKIYSIINGELSLWLDNEKIQTPNGLMAEGNNLLVGENSVFAVDFNTKEIKTVVKEGGGIDGLERDNKGRIVFSHWAGRIFIVNEDTPVKVWDTSTEGINTADLDFAFKPGLLLVPTFSDNRVIAFKISD
ncbi:MAG: hypothetical protein JXR31_13625 [Prolixibacteraceae bacterium]|nr:hypothetical protein [Prolixibacteraceae bacterium]MBN2775290.1 hypothetical protein [Prolixibacteraceae bacterium]